MNGMRQPQLSSAACDITDASTAPARRARQDAADARRSTPMAPIRARLPGLACSTMKTIEVVYSPPTDRPWIMRSSVSRIGAATPSA